MSKATVTVELTADEDRLLQGFRKAQAADDAYRAGLQKTGQQSEETGKQMVESMLGAAKAATASTERIIKDLQRTGVEGKAMASAVAHHLQATGQSSLKTTDSLLSRLRDINPEAAKAADRAFADLKSMEAKANKDLQFQGLLGNLKLLGAEGSNAASRIERELKLASDKSSQDFNSILAKIVELDPTAAGVADQIQSELADAAKYSEGKFADVLEELRRLGPEGSKVAEELRSELVGAGKLVEKSIDDIIEKLAKIDPAAAKAASEIKSKLGGAAKDSDSAFQKFGKSAAAQLSSVAASYVGIHEAIQTVIDLNRKARETSREAFDSITKTQGGDQRLLQVAANPADFQSLRATSDQLASRYGLDRNAARNLVFSGRSENFSGALDFIAANSQVIDPEAQARVAGQLPSLLSGRNGRRLSPEQAVNATLAGATASRLSFEQIASALPGAAEGTSLLGSSAGETVSALSVLASRFQSSSTAADRLKTFGAKAALDDRLKGKGLLGAVAALQQFSEGDRSKFLGESVELNTAFAYLSEESNAIRQRQRGIDYAISATGTQFSPTAIRRQAAAADPRLQSLLAQRQSAVKLEIARELRRGPREGLQQAGVNAVLQQAEGDGVAPIRIEFAEGLGEAVRGFGGDAVDVTALAAGNQLSNLERDFLTATRAGDNSVNASLLAVRDLRQSRATDDNAILSSSVTANLLRQATGRFVSPANVTTQQRLAATRAIDRQARGAAGFGRTASEFLFRGFEGTNVPFLGGAANAAAAEGSQSAAEITAELRRTNALLRQIAGNTNERSRRPTDAMRATANQR